MAHTPAPWTVKNEWWVIATRGEHEGEILIAPTYWMESGIAEAAANARLIAAAPDLLAALKAYEQWEADLIMRNEAWANTTPRIPQDLWDRLLEIQAMRNAAIAKVESV